MTPSPLPTAAVRRRAFTARLWPRRLGAQLRLMVSLVLWASLLALGAHTIREQTALALGSIEQQAAGLARTVALASVNPILNEQLDQIEALLLQSAQLPQVQSITVLDAQGAPLGQAERRADGQVRPVFAKPGARVAVPALAQPQLSLQPGGQRVEAWQPVRAGELVGWVHVEHSTALLVALRERVLKSTLLACLLAGLAGAAWLAWMMRRPLQAIQQARDLAEGLARVDGAQIAVLPGPEDTMALGRALNQASSHLLAQHQTIQRNFAALQAQEATLADTNERLRTLFELSPDGLVSLDTDDRVRFVNPAFCRLAGLPAAQLLGQPLAWLDAELRTRCAPGEPCASLDTVFSTTATPLEAAAPAHPPRQRITLAQPQFTVLELTGVHSAVGTVQRLLHVRDITHESQVDRMKSQFLAVAAHELRTPMTSIHACLELLRSREFEAPRRQHLLGIMNRQSTAMVGIINDLLDLARIEAQQDLALDLQALPLGAAVAEALAAFSPPPDRPAPEVPAAHPEDGLIEGASVTVKVDPRRLTQVLVNLLSNAYKYAKPEAAPDAPVVAVRLLPPQAGPADAPGPWVGIALQDQGIGLSPDQLARLGERFYRADPSGHIPGSGLGLAIVRELVTRMGGRLAFDSTLGQGTTATVWLPLAAEPDAEAEPACVPGAATPVGGPKAGAAPEAAAQPDVSSAPAPDLALAESGTAG